MVYKKIKDRDLIFGLVILVLGAAVLYFCLIQPQITSPKFNITENTCDDVGKICDKHCMNFCLEVSSDAIDMNYTFSNSLYERMYGCLNYNECCQDDCGPQEVNEIIKAKFPAGSQCVSSTDENSCQVIEGVIYKVFSKEELTKDWLDENCECAKKEIECKNGLITEDGSCCKYYQCDHIPKFKCSQYSCFDKYTVEVLK